MSNSTMRTTQARPHKGILRLRSHVWQRPHLGFESIAAQCRTSKEKRILTRQSQSFPCRHLPPILKQTLQHQGPGPGLHDNSGRCPLAPGLSPQPEFSPTVGPRRNETLSTNEPAAQALQLRLRPAAVPRSSEPEGQSAERPKSVTSPCLGGL